jgi:hypothetical protein
METKQKQNRTQAKNSDSDARRVVKAHLLTDMDVVEFKVSLMRNGKEEKAFGGGAVKKQDLHEIIAALAQFARELELTEAEAKGYQRAMQKGNEDQIDYYANVDNDSNDNNDNDEQQDNQNDDEQDND